MVEHHNQDIYIDIIYQVYSDFPSFTCPQGLYVYI